MSEPFYSEDKAFDLYVSPSRVLIASPWLFCLLVALVCLETDVREYYRRVDAAIPKFPSLSRSRLCRASTVEKFRCTATSRILFSSIAPSELKTSKLTIEPCRWSFVCRLRGNVTPDARVHKDSKLLCHWLISVSITLFILVLFFSFYNQVKYSPFFFF
uniref:Uncharacterized protein n=1 Tax=Glossina palpalis gambiensis TaxID=67801 RepID=A0A1B0BWV5_9MUSC